MRPPVEPLALPLGWLQRWMQDLVLHPRPLGGAPGDPRERHALRAALIPRLITGSRAQSPEERLGVYRDMVALRFEGTLAADHPAVREAAGDEAFAALARAYVEAEPSRSFTLDRLGDAFPEFLRSRAPAAGIPSWLADLAALERALREVEAGRESPDLDPAALAAVPDEAWAGLRFVPAATFRLASFETSIGTVHQAFQDGRPLRPPARRPCHLALLCRGGRVRRLPLSRSARDLLAALAGGLPLGEALAAAFEDGAAPPRRLQRWLARWVGAGLFQRVVP